MDDGLVKDLTGGDRINARRMREDEWSFAPTHKFFMSGNHKPRIASDDGGIWRRVHLVPWLAEFKGDDMDTELPRKLAEEMSGILSWAVQGCLDWQRFGLVPPKPVVEATQAYREESGPLKEFLDLRCRLDASGRVSRRALREAYDRYCRDNSERFPMSARSFTAKIRSLGCADTTVSEELLGKTFVLDGWKGIRLLSSEELMAKDYAKSGTQGDQGLTN